MSKWKNILILTLLFGALIAVRFFENIFYDPLRVFFERDYLHNELPDYQQGKLLLHLFFRYLLNSIISIGIIWVAFRNSAYIRFSLLLYSLAFVVLVLVFVLLLQSTTDSYITLFYVRRFIIQPLFVLLLLPAFYYQEKVSYYD